MKNVKVMMITLIMCLTTSMSFGQKKVNKEKLSFLNKSNQLTTAVGWSYNTTLNEWVDYDNVIESEIFYRHNSVQTSLMMSRNKQNFISIQTKTLIYKNVKYYVLLVEKWNGNHKSYNGKKIDFHKRKSSNDWRIYKTTYGYIFPETEYCKLYNMNDFVNLETQYMVFMGSYYEKYKEPIFLNKIQTELSSDKFEYNPTYRFQIKKTENRNIKFQIPNYNQIDFNKGYFETTLSNFKKFIIK